MSEFYGSSTRTAAPLILTATMEDVAASRFDAMRKAYFPVERNILPAHLTLFHALPGESLDEVEEELSERCWREDAMDATAAGLRFTGNGVAIVIECPRLDALRVGIAQSWFERLTPQDRQRYRPHVTVQNKVTPAHARRTFDALQSVFEPVSFAITGLDLWFYRGGPWERATSFPFGGAPD